MECITEILKNLKSIMAINLPKSFSSLYPKVAILFSNNFIRAMSWRMIEQRNLNITIFRKNFCLYLEFQEHCRDRICRGLLSLKGHLKCLNQLQEFVQEWCNLRAILRRLIESITDNPLIFEKHLIHKDDNFAFKFRNYIYNLEYFTTKFMHEIKSSITLSLEMTPNFCSISNHLSSNSVFFGFMNVHTWERMTKILR